ncbi:MAG: DNA polymerase III subunit gamma/tau [Planctomycetaceae bacterium]
MSALDASLPNSDERYVVVARRYRPKSFGELVGQQHVGQALCNAIETNRVGHAYLFTGARGVGKTSTARIFAKALNDPGGPTAEPDNESDIAQAIDAGEDVDVLEIDGASNRGIDEIRSLRANIGVRPSRSRYKIYIIDEVHMLTAAAFNALLKTLEEPPPHVKFIFCTTDPEKIPITVLSRCQRFDFSPVKSEEIMARLREIVTAENVQADDEALRLIARRADGSMRDSQSLLEQVISFGSGPITAQTVHLMIGTADDTRLHEMAQVLARGDAAGALALVDRAASEGIAAGQFTEQLLGYFRDLIAVTVGCPPQMQRHTSESLHDELRAIGVGWGVERLLAIVGMIDQTLVRIRHTVHGRVLLEAVLVQICHLPDLQSLSDLVATLTSGGSSGAVTARPRIESAPASRSIDPEKKNAEPALSIPAAAADSSGPMRMATTAHAVSSTATRVDARQPTAPPGLARQLGTAAVGTATGLAPNANRFGNPSMAGTSQMATAARPAASHSPAGQPAASHSSTNSASVKFAPAPEPVAAAPVVTKSRVQRIREMEANAYVKRCMEMFEGEIIRIDSPRSETRALSSSDAAPPEDDSA